MRSVEINTREIHLYPKENYRFLIRGEIPECDREVSIDLSQIFLEFSLSCENYHEPVEAVASIKNFSICFANELIHQLETLISNLQTEENIQNIFYSIVRSLEVK